MLSCVGLHNQCIWSVLDGTWQQASVPLPAVVPALIPPLCGR